MDITPKYIKMCEKAEEIQEEWNFEDGDFYLHRFPDKKGKFVGKEVIMCLCPSCNVKYSHGDTYVSEYSPKGENIWLPRQDQLQEMVEKREITYFLVEDFSDFMLDNLLEDHGKVPYTPPFKKEWARASIEQLWLAFVMKEKFNKIWDNKEETWT